MRVLVIFILVLTALYVWPGFAVPPAPEPLPPKRVFAAKPAPKPAEAPDPNPECRWSQGMRSDASVRCQGDPELPPRQIARPGLEARSHFPVIDVDAACRAMYGPSGNQTVAGCIRREQLAYDVSQYAWAQLPAPIQAKCNASADKELTPAGYGGHVFYTVLGGCLSAELETERLRRDAASPPRFRY